MKAGTLNKRATFQSSIRTPDGGGGWSETWGNDLTVWASFTPEKAREKIMQGRIADNQAGVLHVRSSVATRAINAAHRVTVNSVTFNIRGHTNPDQVNDMLEFIVEVDGTATSTATP